VTENELAAVAVDVAFKIHTTIGPGLLESVYQAIMLHELQKRGLRVEDEVPVPVVWDGLQLEVGFRADLIVESKLVLELKSIEQVAPIHKKQLLTYLRLTNCHLGLLINFNVPLIKDGISRVVNQLAEQLLPLLFFFAPLREIFYFTPRSRGASTFSIASA
jgi:GxxExxY protein